MSKSCMLSMSPSEAKNFSSILKTIMTDAALDVCHDRDPDTEDPDEWLKNNKNEETASEIAEHVTGNLLGLIRAMDEFADRCGDKDNEGEHKPNRCREDDEDEEYVPDTDKKKGMKADVMFG